MSTMAQKKVRSTNFTPSEVELLIDLVLKHAHIESKKTDVATWKDKGNEWEKLKEEFNASSSICQRTVKCLKTKYEGMKKDIKKKRALQKQNLYKTGGGDFKDIVFEPVEEKVLNLISFSIEGLPPRDDCDEISEENVPVTHDSIGTTSKNEMSSDILVQCTGLMDLNSVTSDQLIILEPDAQTELPGTSESKLSPSQEPQRGSNWSTWNQYFMTGYNFFFVKGTLQKRKACETKNEAIAKVALISSAKKNLIDLQCESIMLDIEHKKKDQDIKTKKAEAEMELIRLEIENKKIDRKIKLITLKKLNLNNKLTIKRRKRSN